MKIAYTPPAMCSACFAQYPDRVHVDFETSWDGPTIDNGIMGEDGRIANHLRVTIDELVICEDCVKAGARLLGMGEQAGEEIAALRAAGEVLSEENAGLREYVKSLERTVAAKPQRAKAIA